jgi:hypothetical protein
MTHVTHSRDRSPLLSLALVLPCRFQYFSLAKGVCWRAPAALDGVGSGLQGFVGGAHADAPPGEAAAARGLVVGVGLYRVWDAQDGLPQLLHTHDHVML